MTCGIILIQVIENGTLWIYLYLYITILPDVDNKLIKANFKVLVNFRININLFRCLRLTCIMKLK